jgi:hypothetical protein
MDRPCETCGQPIQGAGAKFCDGCWEVEHRLDGYLRDGGEKAQRKLAEALVKALPPVVDTPLLYNIGPPHLKRVRAVADRLYSGRALEGHEMRELSIVLMQAVRFAESLEALRAPGEAYVHLRPREP